MSKKTNYKRLWRKGKEKIIALHEANIKIAEMVESYGQLLQDIKDGKVKFETAGIEIPDDKEVKAVFDKLEKQKQLKKQHE